MTTNKHISRTTKHFIIILILLLFIDVSWLVVTMQYSVDTQACQSYNHRQKLILFHPFYQDFFFLKKNLNFRKKKTKKQLKQIETLNVITFSACSYASTTRSAHKISSSLGSNTRLMVATCDGWMAKAPVKPSRRAWFKYDSRPASSRKLLCFLWNEKEEINLKCFFLFVSFF